MMMMGRMRRKLDARFMQIRDDKSDKDVKVSTEDVDIQTQPVVESNNNNNNKTSSPSQPHPSRFRLAAPFILSHNVTRGVMFAISAVLNFLFMLAVM